MCSYIVIYCLKGLQNFFLYMRVCLHACTFFVSVVLRGRKVVWSPGAGAYRLGTELTSALVSCVSRPWLFFIEPLSCNKF